MKGVTDGLRIDISLRLTCHWRERLINFDEPANRRQGNCHLRASVKLRPVVRKENSVRLQLLREE